MLSDPGTDFHGGGFSTMEGPGPHKKWAFGKGDALVFVSHKYHCVAPVMEGLRESSHLVGKGTELSTVEAGSGIGEGGSGQGGNGPAF